MPITNHVTSLELSRRLKELNVPQSSMFWWIEWGTDEDICDEESIEFHKRSDYPRVVFCHTQSPKHGVPPKSIITSAYLASELGEYLKKADANLPYTSSSWSGWEVRTNTKGYKKYIWVATKGDKKYLWAATEVDCRAMQLIHLLENHLISVEELGK